MSFRPPEKMSNSYGCVRKMCTRRLSCVSQIKVATFTSKQNRPRRSHTLDGNPTQSHNPPPRKSTASLHTLFTLRDEKAALPVHLFNSIGHTQNNRTQNNRSRPTTEKTPAMPNPIKSRDTPASFMTLHPSCTGKVGAAWFVGASINGMQRVKTHMEHSPVIM